jgi:hypothetical protein
MHSLSLGVGLASIGSDTHSSLGRARHPHTQCAPCSVRCRRDMVTSMRPIPLELPLDRRPTDIAPVKHPDGAAAAAAASARQVAELLAQFERTLCDMSDTCYALAPTIVPRPSPAGQVRRFDRGHVPVGRPLSRESQAHALSTLHELGAAIQGSARLCLSARGTLVSIADRAVVRSES